MTKKKENHELNKEEEKIIERFVEQRKSRNKYIPKIVVSCLGHIKNVRRWYPNKKHKYVITDIIEEYGWDHLRPRQICEDCNQEYKDHGGIREKHEEGYDLVCPGDWIVEDKDGWFVRFSNESFNKYYRKNSIITDEDKEGGE